MKKTTLLLIALFRSFNINLAACSGGDSASTRRGLEAGSYGDDTNQHCHAKRGNFHPLDSNGQFGGNVGCNPFGADYKVKGSDHLGSIVSTLMILL